MANASPGKARIEMPAKRNRPCIATGNAADESAAVARSPHTLVLKSCRFPSAFSSSP
jgi:hypothetical protein